MAFALLLAGCSAGQGPEAIPPLISHMFGPANEGREPPPGVGMDYPNLGTVPPRPAIPDPQVRDALTAALAQERQRSRNPLDPETNPRTPGPAGTAGDSTMPMAPPGRPSLAGAPRIPWEAPDTAPAAPAASTVPAPATGTPAAPAATTAPAQGQPARLPEMGTTPPPPPPSELLAPGAAPPPPPPADLLAPSRR
jgi:hypothetical protein